MITKEAIYHRPKGAYSYAYDKDTLHIRVRTKKHEVEKVSLRIGDPYHWAQGGGGGNLNAEGAWGWIGGEYIVMTLEATTDMFDYWIAEATPQYKRARYAFVLESTNEKLLYGEKIIVALTPDNESKELQNVTNFFCFPFLNNIDVFNAPSWVKDAIFYQIFPERFCNGDISNDPHNVMPWGSKPEVNNFMGGDLEGVYQKLDYIEALGINAIYFCPIFESPSNHKYDTINYKKIDPHFGNDTIFKKLVAEAHRRGIKIMIDAVFNHAGRLSPMWQDVLKNGTTSQYKDWFCIRKFPVIDKTKEGKECLNYDAFAFVGDMPKLNTENLACKAYLLEVARYWVEEFHIDAWRLDVANEVDHAFWRDFRKVVKGINPDCYILGEIWHDAMPWLYGDQFDAVMNYTMTDAIIGYFANNTLNAEEFMYAVNRVNTSLPRSVVEATFNLLDSHDTARILYQCGDDARKASLAYIFQFTLSGAPCIYYGDEIGLSGGADPMCRKTMPWDENDHDLDFKRHIKTLIMLRKTYKAFNSSEIRWLATNTNNSIIYAKKSPEGDIIIIINNSSDTQSINLPLQLSNQTVYEIYKQTEHSLEDTVLLEPYGFAMYRLMS